MLKPFKNNIIMATHLFRHDEQDPELNARINLSGT